VGTRLYQALLTISREQGYCQAFAGITLPNEASQRLHLGLGFQRIGTFKSVGFKFGEWHDVAWLQKPLNPVHRPPSEIQAVSDFDPTALEAWCHQQTTHSSARA
jgi:hypothetical protein